jgi:hypothetical protein
VGEWRPEARERTAVSGGADPIGRARAPGRGQSRGADSGGHCRNMKRRSRGRKSPRGAPRGALPSHGRQGVAPRKGAAGTKKTARRRQGYGGLAYLPAEASAKAGELFDIVRTRMRRAAWTSSRVKNACPCRGPHMACQREPVVHFGETNPRCGSATMVGRDGA